MVHQTIRELDEKHSTQECSSIYSNINSEDPEFEEKGGGGHPISFLYGVANIIYTSHVIHKKVLKLEETL